MWCDHSRSSTIPSLQLRGYKFCSIYSRVLSAWARFKHWQNSQDNRYNMTTWINFHFHTHVPKRYGESYEKNGHCNANPFLKWIVKTQWLIEDNRDILSGLGIHSAKKWHFGYLWWSWDEKLFSDVWTGQNRVQFVEIPTHQVYQLPMNISDLLCDAGKVFTRHRLDNPVNQLGMIMDDLLWFCENRRSYL